MTGNQPHDSSELTELFWDYLQGDLTQEQARELEQALLDSPDAVADCTDLIDLVVMTREVCQRSGAARKELQFNSAVGPDDSAAHAALTELARLEGVAQVIPVDYIVGRRVDKQPEAQDPASLSASDIASVGGYLLRQALTSKPAILAYAAAVALLATVLLIPRGGQAPDPIAQHAPPSTQPSDAPINAVNVATLTAAHEAQWSNASPQVGDALDAGQSLTLTQGFAQITTRDGAVAIIEAPCTVELIDNNALRLHAGQLVGICETESSHGFVVRTPHMDITDLGTRFGVQIEPGGLATMVQVYEGEVDVAPRLTAGERTRPVRLTAHQAIHGIGQHALQSVAFEPAQILSDGMSRMIGHVPFEGTTQWAGPLAAASDPWAESDVLKIFTERQGVVLPDGLSLERTSNVWSATPIVGVRADVYLLHLDPPGQDTRRDRLTLRFDRPIIGVITSGDQLLATDSTLGAIGVDYAPVNTQDLNYRPRGIDPSAFQEGFADVVEISEDGMSLSLDLQTGMHADQFRVVIEHEAKQPAP